VPGRSPRRAEDGSAPRPGQTQPRAGHGRVPVPTLCRCASRPSR
jgi:hypothetical protein